jgi:hypothetical protein
MVAVVAILNLTEMVAVVPIRVSVRQMTTQAEANHYCSEQEKL